MSQQMQKIDAYIDHAENVGITLASLMLSRQHSTN